MSENSELPAYKLRRIEQSYDALLAVMQGSGNPMDKAYETGVHLRQLGEEIKSAKENG